MDGITKLTNELKNVKGDRYISATKSAVFESLCDLCNKSERFDDLIGHSDRTFSDCMTEIVKGIGSSISDIDLFRRAVQFYVPGADLRFDLHITLPDEAETPVSNIHEPQIISIFDVL